MVFLHFPFLLLLQNQTQSYHEKVLELPSLRLLVDAAWLTKGKRVKVSNERVIRKVFSKKLEKSGMSIVKLALRPDEADIWFNQVHFSVLSVLRSIGRSLHSWL